MRVLFIQNLGINESLAVADLSAFLKSNGHACDLLIERNERNLFSAIRVFSPDVFIIPWDIGTDTWVLRIADVLKKEFNKPMAFCGTYPSFYPDTAINSSAVETICMGESEYAMLDLINTLEKGGDISGIKNLWVKKDGRIYRNELRPLIPDLDMLPPPDRGIYFKYAYLREISFKRFTSGRGCPHSCSFCYNPVFRKSYKDKGNYVRRKSPSRIIQEIGDLREIAVLKSVHFSDDIFTYDRGWISQFSKEYKKEIDLPFTCNGSADSIDEELVILLKEAHCTGIAVGVESGNEELRNGVLNKKIRNSQIIETARLIKKHGLFLVTFNMIGTPTETAANVFETIELNTRIKTDHARLALTFPLPGTEMAWYVKEKGYCDEKLLEQLLAQSLSQKRIVVNSEDKRKMENLFYLFRIGTRCPVMVPLIKIIMHYSFLVRILSLADFLIGIYGEKKFFNITWYSGIKFSLHSGKLEMRSKVFNNFMP